MGRKEEEREGEKKRKERKKERKKKKKRNEGIAKKKYIHLYFSAVCV